MMVYEIVYAEGINEDRMSQRVSEKDRIVKYVYTNEEINLSILSV